MAGNLSLVIQNLESGSRPKGGVRGSSAGVPSIGAEHLNDKGGFSFQKIKFVPDEFFEKQKGGIVKKEDILIVKDGATTGKVAYVENDFPFEKASVNEHVFILRINPKLAMPKYIFWHLFSETGKRQILKDFRGATVGGISRGFTKNINLEIPPIEEQKRIVNNLDQADILRRKRKEAIALLEEYLKSSFLEMFGDPVKNQMGWKVSELSKAVTHIASGWSANGENREKTESEFGVLKISAVTYGVFRPQEYKAVSSADIKGKKLLHPKQGAILFSRANTRELVGASCIVEKDYPDLFLPDKLWEVEVNRSLLEPIFFQKCISQNSWRSKLTKKATGTSGSMLNISMEKFRDENIILPPLELQAKFTEIATAVEHIKQNMILQSDELDARFHSLMQRSFRHKA